MDDLHKRVESRIYSLERHIDGCNDEECTSAWTQEVLDLRQLLKRSARVAELESRLAEIEAQEPVGFVKRGTVMWDGTHYVAQIIVTATNASSELKRGPVGNFHVYARPVPAHLYCPNCYCTCCMNETRSNAK